jgi:hypothetical protein
MRNFMLVAVLCASVLTLSAFRAHAQTPTNVFDIVLVAASPTTWESIKYNTVSGEAWIAQTGQWIPIEDKTKIPQGHYVVKMTILSADWAALRLDVTTGRSWQCRAGAWVEMMHAPAAPSDPPADPKLVDDGKKKP